MGSIIVVTGTIMFFVESIDMDDVMRKIIREDIKELYIDGEYIYTAYSKLLVKQSYKRSSDSYYITLSDFLNTENYYSKSEIRDNKLNKLGI